MIRIRTKLLIYFIIIVVLVNGVAFFLYDSSEDILDEYEASFERFLLLNEISQRTNVMVDYVNAYLVEKDKTYLEEFQRERNLLNENKRRLTEDIEKEQNYVLIRNYKNMLDSFVNECTIAVEAFNRGNVNQYSAHFNEATRISSFIQETTLSVLNKELSAYILEYSYS
ncbi:hypothetical protein [Paenisporosarcina sp. TG20]|uniref:CHASE3 domain-containing protein n=1 Tax=Paenisporosarcina sp. TG20 TaxID=1211706 RepID=UPI00031E597A|nr:hypothetical protein [Paenisporosarcina sp. TG20]